MDKIETSILDAMLAAHGCTVGPPLFHVLAAGLAAAVRLLLDERQEAKPDGLIAIQWQSGDDIVALVGNEYWVNRKHSMKALGPYRSRAEAAAAVAAAKA